MPVLIVMLVWYPSHMYYYMYKKYCACYYLLYSHVLCVCCLLSIVYYDYDVLTAVCVVLVNVVSGCICVLFWWHSDTVLTIVYEDNSLLDSDRVIQ